jgi:hypothetical protein
MEVTQREFAPGRIRKTFLFFFLFLFSGLQGKAVLQFDIFVGYDGIVREASWFPVGCEVFNDGPSFNAVVEIQSGGLGSDQVRRIPLELPTNTRKRFVIPFFGTGSRVPQWNVRLLDERGKVIAEQMNLQPRMVMSEAILLGGLPRTFGGLPALPDVRGTRPELKPSVARMQAEMFPESPMALEGLTAFYLNSEKALDLRIPQIGALLSWVQNGGHLIVSVEQLGDVIATPWLQQMLPFDLEDIVSLKLDREISDWIRMGPEESARFRHPAQPGFRPGPGSSPLPGGQIYDELSGASGFEEAEMVVATGSLREGRVLLEAQGLPLIVEAHRGRGKVTLLTFNPEREPLRTWTHRGWFWARLLEISPEYFANPSMVTHGGRSIDAVFGALLETDQIRTLPVEWLLVLLLVYLVVIGPLDQYWLKRVNRQMLTWVTFPAYVVFFSVLIWYIGYRLRAGENEWNELHVVDVNPRGEQAELRGRTYASIYSNSNAKFPLAGDQAHASLRGEWFGFGVGNSGAQAHVWQEGNSYRAEIYVPVWTSLLYVHDWVQPAAHPFRAQVAREGNGWKGEIQNNLNRPLTEMRLILGGRVFELETISARERKEFRFGANDGIAFSQFLQPHGHQFASVVDQRRQTLGRDHFRRLTDPARHGMAASFPAHLLPRHQHDRGFLAAPGFDLSPVMERGDAIFMAFDANQAPIEAIRKFNTPRGRKDTLFRLATPVGSGG